MKINYCVWCGLVDHHMVDGTCPQCQQKVQTQPLTGNASCDHTLINGVYRRVEQAQSYGDVPLGVEAANVEEAYRV